MHGASNRHTHLYPPHNSSVHLTTTAYVRRSGRITDGMRSGWTTPRESVLSSPTPASTLLEWSCQEQHGSEFNLLRIGVGLFRCCLHKWRMSSSAACECGAEEQTVEHVVLCPIHRPPHELHGLAVLDDEIL